ncbi:unnamed protein product, partial [Didymodactylos carnosus]
VLPSTKQISEHIPKTNHCLSTSRIILVRSPHEQQINTHPVQNPVRSVLINSNNDAQQSSFQSYHQKSTKRNIILNESNDAQHSSDSCNNNQHYKSQSSRTVLLNEQNFESQRKIVKLLQIKNNGTNFTSVPPLPLYNEKFHYNIEKPPRFHQNRFPQSSSNTINQDYINSLQCLVESDIKLEEISDNYHSLPLKTRQIIPSTDLIDEEHDINGSVIFTNSSYTESPSEKIKQQQSLNSLSSSPHQISFETNESNEQRQQFNSGTPSPEKVISTNVKQIDTVATSYSSQKQSQSPSNVVQKHTRNYHYQQQEQTSHLLSYNQHLSPRFQCLPVKKKEYNPIQQYQQDFLSKTYARLPHSLRLQDNKYQTQTAISQRQIQPLFQTNKTQTISSQACFSIYSNNDPNHINHSSSVSNGTRQRKNFQPKFNYSEHQEKSKPPRLREPGCCDEPCHDNNYDEIDSADAIKTFMKQKMIEIEERMKKNGLLSSLVDTHCHFDLLFDRLSCNKTTVTDYFDKEYKDLYLPNLKFEKAIQVYWRPNHLTRENWSHYSKYLDDPRVYGTCGVHPHWSNKWHRSCADDIERCLQHPKVLGIGECGLDFGP